MIIQLIRHGESEFNARKLAHGAVGDHEISLTTRGEKQARRAGETVGARFIEGALVYASPYRRARETLDGVLSGAGLSRDQMRVFEDPRLREVEHGYGDVESQVSDREKHGYFYYRYQGGESPADCYDRTSGFIESMMRQATRKKAERVLIVTHGLTIRCFVMRFLHLTVEQFDEMRNPRNGDIITVAPKKSLEKPQFASGRWGVVGVRLKEHQPR